MGLASVRGMPGAVFGEMLRDYVCQMGGNVTVNGELLPAQSALYYPDGWTEDSGIPTLAKLALFFGEDDCFMKCEVAFDTAYVMKDMDDASSIRIVFRVVDGEVVADIFNYRGCVDDDVYCERDIVVVDGCPLSKVFGYLPEIAENNAYVNWGDLVNIMHDLVDMIEFL